MAFSRRSSRRSEANIWPGFVDAMTALLLIIMFVLTIFMVIQFALRETITGQETELNDLNLEVIDLASALGLERRRGAELVTQLTDTREEIALQATLISALTTERNQALDESADFEMQVANLLAQNAGLNTRNSDLLALNSGLNSQNNELMALNNGLNSQNDELLAMNSGLNAQNEDLSATLSARDEQLETASQQIAARNDEIAAAQSSIEALTTAKDLETRQREAAEMALLQSRQEIDSEAERARLAAARADALQALVQNLQQNAEQTDTIIRALDQAEAARAVEAAAAEALRERLRNSDTELTAMTLALEEQRRKAEETLTLLAAAEAAKENLNNTQAENVDEITRQRALVAQANALLSEERQISADAQRQVALLNQQIAALRQQLSSLQATLDDSADRDREAKVQLQTLGSDLNAALAQVASEQKARADLEARERARLEAEAVDLQAFRSEFFGRVRQILGEREGVQVVGDRFVFSSEVLFAPGSAVLGDGGQAQISRVAQVIRDIASEIPSEINWILRVDGHTDKVQVGSNSAFADNWELSQARALSVVKYLIDIEGIPADRLAATGFGEFQPIALGDSPAELALNRRIELKLTEK